MRDDPARASRLQEILEAYYSRVDRGEAVALDELCAGDAELERRVAEIIGRESAAVEALAGFSARRPDEDLPVDRLGEFLIRALLGAGGMARVFLAEQESLGRLVALKVLDPASMRDEAARRRFRREAEIAAALDHPNIVPVHAVGEDAGFAYIAMKWLSGPGLDQVEKPLEPHRVAAVGAAVARALEEAHRSGVVHRDVKAANIIFDGDVPYVVDFGLARARRDVTITRQGNVPGTLPYMPPEQLRGQGVGPDARADIYSLGVTLYEAATGRLPFEAERPERLISQILFREPPPLRLPSRERDLETIILRALEKEPARRFPSAAALARDLESYLAGEPIASRPSGPISRMFKLMRRHRRATAAALTGILAVTILAGVLLFRLAGEREAFLGTLHSFDGAVAEGDLDRAATLLGTLQRSRHDAKDVRLRSRRLSALLALEEVLDRIQDRREAQSPKELRRLRRRLLETGGEEVRPWLAGLALTVLSLHLGEKEEAARRLAALERDRPGHPCLLALRAVVRGEELPRETPASMALTAEDHVILGLARRLAQEPTSAQRREIDRALEIDPTNERAKLGLAMLHERQGHHEAALAAFRTLLKRGHRERTLRRHMARLHMILGELERAEVCLSRIPASERTVVDAHQLLLLRWRQGRFDEVASLLEGFLRRWPEEPELLMVKAQLLLHRGREEEAREALTRVTEGSPWSFYRDKAFAILLELRLRELLARSAGEGEPAAWKKALEELERQAADLAAGSIERHPRSVALYVIWKIRDRLGREEEAFAALREATRVDPFNPAPRVDMALRAVRRAMRHVRDAGKAGVDFRTFVKERGPEDLRSWKTLAPLAIMGRTHAQAVIAWEGKGEHLPSKDLVELALRAEAWLARLLQDKEAAGEAARRALQFMEARQAESQGQPSREDAFWRRILVSIREWST